MEDIIKQMEANAKKTLDALAKADADIVAKVVAQEAKDKKFIDEQNALTEQLIKETQEVIDKLKKEEEDRKKDKPKDEVVKQSVIDLTKMTEAELIEYGISIAADVDKKYTKAKNLANVKAKQL